ncbi:DUF551 domain-containing protein [Raoultella ornithinolytica]|uniref:DUF551 domain-containing protein n=1 Tax=Raoultella ornithinolytica TaxID=54291 RepID=UPI001F2CDD86|nr:DUF551 domain-containing protein [Raoultella ornithinolytica]
MTNNQLTDAKISNATLIRLIRWADEHNSHYVSAALRELQERRKAAMDSEPVAFTNSDALADVYCGETSMMGPDGVIGDVPLYRHAEQPVVSATLPCSVELKPGLIIGNGCKTETLLTALRRRADYNADIDAMTLEERAEHDASIKAFKAMLAAAAHDTPALNSVQSVATVPGKWVPVSERMPETDGNYWGWWSESKRQGPVWFIKSELQAQFQSHEITHWMPLPADPQEVNHG